MAFAVVAELVYALVLGTSGAILKSSSLFHGTIIKKLVIMKSNKTKQTIIKEKDINDDLLFSIEKKLLKLRTKEIRAYQFYKKNPLKFLFIDFVEGTMKGIGFFFGGTVVVAIITIIVTRYFVSIPYIGEYFDQLGKILETQSQIELINIDG